MEGLSHLMKDTDGNLLGYNKSLTKDGGVWYLLRKIEKGGYAMDEKQERTWAMLCHLTALAGYIIPFGNIIGPLIVWLVKKEESSLVNENGKEALNFQISMSIYFIVAAILITVVIGLFLTVALAILNLVLIILASVKTNKGEKFTYPLKIPFIK
jgi:hypothetical protein